MLLYFCLLLLSSSAFALKYNVVAIGSTNAAVRINGVDHPLSRKWPDVGYYQGEIATATFNDTYKYVVDGVEEPFDRDWSACKPRSTYNDFFMRQETIKKFDNMGYPFEEKQQWPRNSGPRGVFNDDYISTVVFTGGQEVTTWFMNVANKTERKGMSLVMINRDKETYETEVELNIEDTSQLKPKMKFDFVKNYEGRNGYKLRPSAADPVFIRDKLYNDVLEAVGCPHGESGFTRVYVNDVPLGLYNLQESPSSKDFIKTQFYGVDEYLTKRPLEVGSFVDASTGADFALDANIGAFKPGKGMTNTGITALIQELDRLNPANTADYDNFHQRWFDVDYFFRAIALQYLSAHYDSYWFMTTNFVVYNEITEDTPNAKKFYFVDQDFDQTYGINLTPQYNPYGTEYPRQPYTVYVNANWTVVPYDAPKRTMVDKLLANEDYKNKFEAILKTLVEKIFNPVQLNRRIDDLISRIRPEVEWDYNLGASRAHQGRPEDPLAVTIRWTMTDFENGLTASVGGNWGLKTYIAERSAFVQTQFAGLTFQDPPLLAPSTPCTAGDNNATETTGKPPGTGSQTTLTGISGTVDPESSASSVVASFVALVALVAALL